MSRHQDDGQKGSESHAPEHRIDELAVRTAGQSTRLRCRLRTARLVRRAVRRLDRLGGVAANSWEWTSLAITTSRVDALKRGLQVVRVTHAPDWFCRIAPSDGETTWLPVVSYTKMPCTVVKTMGSPILSTLRL